MTKILAIDLGKFKSVACTYQAATGGHEFTTIPTRPQDVHDLIVQEQPDRVVIEVGAQSGWVCDLCETLGITIQVANTNHEAWRWKNVKRKTDKDDALKLAQLSSMNQLPLVILPARRVRQWRSLIAYRHTLVSRRTAIKNSIRAILDRQAIAMPPGKSGWTKRSMQALVDHARPLEQTDGDELWRGQLHMELRALDQIQQCIDPVEQKLQVLAEADARVARLRTIPGVGPRLAEVVVATIDDPKRFKTAKQVGAYAGLVPKQYESGTVSRQGNKLLRAPHVSKGFLHVSTQRAPAWGLRSCVPRQQGAPQDRGGGHSQEVIGDLLGDVA